MREPLEKLVGYFLDANRDSHPEESQLIENLRALSVAFGQIEPELGAITESELQLAADSVLSKIRVRMDFGSVLVAASHKPWLEDRKSEMTWSHSEAYVSYLKKLEGIPPKIVSRLDETTDKLLDLAGDPTSEGKWCRKGLVIGQVQSGKTSNIIGLLNKASDAGYKLLIVLGGHTEPLRRQTQIRVDHGLTGRDTEDLDLKDSFLSRVRRIGVANYWDGQVKVQSFTTQLKDFDSHLKRGQNYQLTNEMGQPVVLVIKKNWRVLQNINSWLSQQHTQNLATLIIDDESDFASVNTNKEESDPTKVNAEIRRMLSMSDRSTYVAFTATPFANILIDDEADATIGGDPLDDLFPRDFIFSLKSATNYIGPREIFGRNGSHASSVVTDLEDADEFFPTPHRSTHQVEGLPDSLMRAIMSFLVAISMRRTRGDGEANKTMMVNVSSYNAVQSQVLELLQGEVKKIKNDIRYCLNHEGEIEKQTTTVDRFIEVAQTDFNVDPGSIPELLKALKIEGDSLAVELRNSLTRNIEPGSERNKIVIGGHVLSRGITLDGLVTSYFVRSSTAMDTLLQMGRWFGYRDRYADLTRIFLRGETAEWFALISDVIEELLDQIDQMNDQGLPPSEFGIRIRMHPGRLRVTAASKSRNATEKTIRVSMAGTSHETWKIAERNLARNWAATVALLDEINQMGISNDLDSGRVVFRDVPLESVVRFLDAFKAETYGTLVSSTIRDLVKKLSASRDMTPWDIAISEGNAERRLPLPGSRSIRPNERALRPSGDNGVFLVTNNRRVGSQGDLRQSMRAEDVAEYDANYPDSEAKNKEVFLRQHMTRPVLIIFAIVDTGEKKTDREPIPDIVAAYALHFPSDVSDGEPRSGREQRYLFNTVAMKQEELMDFDSFLNTNDGEDSDDY